MTLTDEVGRQQKVYSDVVGRQWKTEVLNWNGTVYSTTTNAFNGRDQVTLVRQWTGAENGGGAYQDTTMSYDGYGRLKTKHVPEQNAGTATVYAYNSDDTIQSVTDARGASATYSYNNRHLITSINSAPSGIPATPNVTFGYDAAGNRTSMSNSNSSATYHYDQMSRMDWEERTFSGLSGLYRLSYGYNLAGQLATLNQPSQFGTTVTYTHDAAGRLANVTGSGYGATTQFATGLQYRAWGAAKHANYGSGAQLNLTFNSRLLVTRYELSNLPPTGYPPQVSPMGTQNQFYADGRIQYAQDLQNGNFDRAYEYDHVARLQHGTSGREARGLPPVFPRDNPFHQNYSYDAWNNMARPTVQHWSAYLPPDFQAYTNNRRADWGYNANGQVISRDQEQKLHTYNASGQTVHYWEQIYHPGSEETWFNERNTIEQTYDGDAQRIKRLETREVENAGGSNTQADTSYYLTSSVLGGAVVTEINGLDLSRTERIYANGEMIATHWSYSPQTYSTTWRHVNSVTGVWVNSYVGSQAMRNELDPLGSDVGTADPYVSYSGPSYSDIAPISLYEERGNPFDPGGGCGTVDGIPISCSELNMRMQGGSVSNESLVNRGRGWETLRDPVVDRGVGIFTTYNYYFDGNREFRANGYVVTVPQSPGIAEREAQAVEWARRQVEKNYDACKKELGNSPESGRKQAADILSVENLEGVDATLLAATWGREGGFEKDGSGLDYRPTANYRGKDDGGYDVGPGQIASTYYNKKPFTTGLPQAFGTNFSETVEFNGNPYQNLRATARALNHHLGPVRGNLRGHVAGLHRAGSGDFIKTTEGKAVYDIRVGEFQEWQAGYDRFFDCLKNGPRNR